MHVVGSLLFERHKGAEVRHQIFFCPSFQAEQNGESYQRNAHATEIVVEERYGVVVVLCSEKQEKIAPIVGIDGLIRDLGRQKDVGVKPVEDLEWADRLSLVGCPSEDDLQPRSGGSSTLRHVLEHRCNVDKTALKQLSSSDKGLGISFREPCGVVDS